MTVDLGLLDDLVKGVVRRNQTVPGVFGGHVVIQDIKPGWFREGRFEVRPLSVCRDFDPCITVPYAIENAEVVARMIQQCLKHFPELIRLAKLGQTIDGDAGAELRGQVHERLRAFAAEIFDLDKGTSEEYRPTLRSKSVSNA